MKAIQVLHGLSAVILSLICPQKDEKETSSRLPL